MKSLSNFINESLIDEEDMREIYNFINDNYKFASSQGDKFEDYENKTTVRKESGIYIIDFDGVITPNEDIEYLTNDLFNWGEVAIFELYNCNKLKSLVGAPKSITDLFRVEKCNGLSDLVGAPQKVVDFKCMKCDKISSFNGFPKVVYGDVQIEDLPKLTSLRGMPEQLNGDLIIDTLDGLTDFNGLPRFVKGDFTCMYCKNIKSSNGLPKSVKGDFVVTSCGDLPHMEELPQRN